MADSKPANTHVCPWWGGYFLASPLRKLFENPEAWLGPLVRPGMTVLEPGCGMGFFTLPIARMVGPAGKVVCVDLQQQMLDGLARRARRAGLLERLVLHRCGPGTLDIERWRGQVDLAVAIHMVHEVPNPAALIGELYTALQRGGMLLMREPRGHVSRDRFESFIAMADAIGFANDGPGPGRRGLSVVLRKRAG